MVLFTTNPGKKHFNLAYSLLSSSVNFLSSECLLGKLDFHTILSWLSKTPFQGDLVYSIGQEGENVFHSPVNEMQSFLSDQSFCFEMRSVVLAHGSSQLSELCLCLALWSGSLLTSTCSTKLNSNFSFPQKLVIFLIYILITQRE